MQANIGGMLNVPWSILLGCRCASATCVVDVQDAPDALQAPRLSGPAAATKISETHQTRRDAACTSGHSTDLSVHD